MSLKVFSLGRKDKDAIDSKDRQKYNALKLNIAELCNQYISEGGILTIEVMPEMAQDFQQYILSNEFVSKYTYSQHEDDPRVYDIQLKDLIEF